METTFNHTNHVHQLKPDQLHEEIHKRSEETPDIGNSYFRASTVLEEENTQLQQAVEKEKFRADQATRGNALMEGLVIEADNRSQAAEEARCLEAEKRVQAVMASKETMEDLYFEAEVWTKVRDLGLAPSIMALLLSLEKNELSKKDIAEMMCNFPRLVDCAIKANFTLSE